VEKIQHGTYHTIYLPTKIHHFRYMVGVLGYQLKTARYLKLEKDACLLVSSDSARNVSQSSTRNRLESKFGQTCNSEIVKKLNYYSNFGLFTLSALIYGIKL